MVVVVVVLSWIDACARMCRTHGRYDYDYDYDSFDEVFTQC